MKTRVLVLFALLPLLPVGVHAQVCSKTATTANAICVMPQVFGPAGFVLENGVPGDQMLNKMGFNPSSPAVFQPVSVGVGEALASLPLGSSGAGVISGQDANGHTVPLFEDSLGPIMMERANAIGKRTVNFGVDYQYFNFSGLQGQNLHNFPAVLLHQAMDPSMPGADMMMDYIQLTNNLNLSINQTVVYGVFGITNRLEASVEVPIEAVHVDFVSRAKIVRMAPCEMNQPLPNCDPSIAGPTQVYHFFGTPQTGAEALSAASTNFKYENVNDATGPGDVMVRAKYQIFEREGSKNAASIGVALRTPTGDANNFLGAGSLGVEPYGAFTRMGQFSPHVLFGYQYNGRSVLFNDSTGGQNHHLPPSVFYAGGVDIRATKRITIAADLIGSRVLDASVLTIQTPTTMMGNSTAPSIAPLYNQNYSYNSIDTGAKIRLSRSHPLVLTGNVSTRVDNGGLRANVVPLVGLSYGLY